MKKKHNIDLLIVGAGPVGCVVAERAAKLKNWKCLIVDKRNHIAGNCYDEINKKGVLIHKYGPHYMRFKKKKIYNYVSKFTKWINGNYIVKSNIDNKLYPIPINLTTLEKFFKIKLKNKKDAIKLLKNKRINIKKIKNSEDFILSKLGRDIYENFYKNYTIKQWGIHPKNLNKSVVGRLPIRFNRNPYYVDQKLKVMPKNGYTALFQNMIKSENIKVKLNTDYKKIKNKIKPKYATIYTGPPDKFFNNKFGKLDWRSLNFKFKTYKKKKIQNCVQINFPNKYKFTRKVEIKHVTKQKIPFTTVCTEYPSDLGDPYYPINNKKNLKIFSKYKKLINIYEKKNIFFEGRLAQYKYLNMDEVIERALNLFNRIKLKFNKK
jgi:UDP-galactopyranose mutase